MRRHAFSLLRQLIVGRLELRAEADGSGFTFTGVGTLAPLLSGSVPALAAVLPRIDSSPTDQKLNYEPVFRGKWLAPKRAA